MDYQETKFSLIWVKENKVTEGGGNPPPQVENVLNHPGEIGLMYNPIQNYQIAELVKE